MPITNCPYCNQSFSVPETGLYECPHCHEKQEVGAVESPSIPWEKWRTLGFMPAIKDTWQQSTLEPVGFFQALKPSGFVREALWYGVLFSTLGAILGYIWQMSWSFFNVNFQDKLNIPLPVISGWWVVTVLALGFMVVPLIVLVSLIIQAAVVHLCLLAFGAARHGFESTFKIVCYATSPMLFSLVPILGNLVASVWSFVILTVALREMHGLTTGKAVLILCAPMLLCCCTCVGLGGSVAIILFKHLSTGL